MTISTALDWATQNPDQIVTIIIAILACIQAVREKLSAREALVLIANTLKDEDKMVDGKFAAATAAKVEKVAAVMGAGTNAVVEVKQAVAQISTNPADHKGDIKIASINGKPIYLGETAAIGSKLSAALGVLRGLIRR